MRLRLAKSGLRVAAVVASTVASTAAGLWLWLAAVTPKPPPLSPGLTPDAVAQAGPGHAARVRDVWFLWLSGPPEVRGADTYRLAGAVMHDIDRALHETFKTVVPSAPLRGAMALFGRIAGRHLDEDIPLEIQREIAGQMYFYDDRYDDGGGKYARFLAYLALHDLAQTIEKSPLVACSGFAVTGAKSASGKTLVGRNFDFEAGPIFDRQKSLTVVSVPGRLKHLNISWPGMNGVVTGVNEKRVWISVNAARSDDEAPRGVPVSLLIRDVLERATSAEAAVDMIKAMPVRVADLYLVADPDRAYVVEKTPARSRVRPAAPEVLVTNHFLDPDLRREKRNQALEARTTSVPRYARLTELVEKRAAPLSAGDVAAVLRDKQTPDGAPYPFGDRRALDAYIATHGVVADLGRDVVWVSRGPHLAGSWLGVKLAPLFDGRVDLDDEVAADAGALEAGARLGERAPGK